MKIYQLDEDRFDAKAGSIVYEYQGYDYGLARDDTRFTGEEHICVTLNPDGEPPFFTVPVNSLTKITSCKKV